MYRVWMEDPIKPSAYVAHRPGRWVAEPSWPSPNIRPAKLALNPGRLGEKPEVESAITVTSPQDTGLYAGAWCPYGLGPDQPSDQREEDGKSLCFDGPTLKETLEILGAPAVELEVSSDRPVAMVAARLCDIHPDGTSERVSYGLLNSHPPREPRASLPARTGEALSRSRAAQRHRAQLQAGPPHPPRALDQLLANLLFHAGAGAAHGHHRRRSSLELPVRAPRKEDAELEDFPPPAGATPLAQTVLRKGGTKRLIERNLATDESVFTRHEDTGTYRIDAIDLTVDQIKTGTYRIKAEDPLSADITISWTQKLARGDWQVRTETRDTVPRHQGGIPHRRHPRRLRGRQARLRSELGSADQAGPGVTAHG